MDIQKNALGPLKGACGMFVKDLEALPDEAFTKSFGPKVRTIADIVYEVILVNDHVGMVIRGEDPFKWPEELWIKAPAEGWSTKQEVVDAFKKSSAKTIETVESFSAEDFEGMIDDKEGGEVNRFERCRFMTLHIWYHMGQINYVQTLLGDDAWHWQS